MIRLDSEPLELGSTDAEGEQFYDEYEEGRDKGKC